MFVIVIWLFFNKHFKLVKAKKKKREEKKHILLREKKSISSPFHLSFKKAKRHYAIHEKKTKKTKHNGKL